MIAIIIVAGIASIGLIIAAVRYARINLKKRKQREYEDEIESEKME